MSETVRWILALIELTRLSTRTALSFRGEVIVGFVSLIARVSLVSCVWSAVYGSFDEVAGVSKSVAISYAVLGAVLSDLMNPWSLNTLAIRVRQGQIGADLLRPLGVVAQSAFQQLGVNIAIIPRSAVAIALAVTLGLLTPPHGGVSGGIVFSLSLMAGALNALITNLIVAMTAFWTLDTGGAMIVYFAVAQFASGAAIPPWFMSDGLRSALSILPFQAQVYTPLSLYFGRVDGDGAVQAISLQVAWLLGLCVIAHLVWRRAVKKVVILGG